MVETVTAKESEQLPLLESLYFHQNYGGYNAGEKAGFTPNKAAKILGLTRDGKPIAEKVADIEARQKAKLEAAKPTKVMSRYTRK